MSNYKDNPKAIRKKGFMRALNKLGLPYPNFGLGETELPSLCRCYFDGQKFFVRHEKDMSILYQNGAFGRSTRTFRGPSGLFDYPFQSQRYYQKQLLRDDSQSWNSITPKERRNSTSLFYSSADLTKNASVQLEPEAESVNVNLSVAKTNGIEMEVEVLDNVDGPSSSISADDEFSKCHNSEKPFLNSTTRKNPLPAIVEPDEVEEEELLILLPEEVIFLSFAVGCISIQDTITGDTLCFQNVWSMIVREREEFPFFYAAYHYFRSKNWVPKDGSSFGADFVLYELGPELYHASYVVHVTGPKCRPQPNWAELYAWQRVASTVGKSVLLCNVRVPPSLVWDQTSTPNCIFKMNLKETVFTRWTHSISENENFDWDD